MSSSTLELYSSTYSTDRTVSCISLPQQEQDDVISQIRFIVYGARNMFGGKGPPRPLYVVFSLGTVQYKTETITSHNPNWVESQMFDVNSSKVPLRLWLKVDEGKGEDDECVGKTTVSIYCLPTENDSKELIARLQPGSSDQSDHGFISYECYATKFSHRNSWRAVHWFKEQYPRAIDYVYNTDLPTCNLDVCRSCATRIPGRDIVRNPRSRQTCNPDPLVLRKMVQIIMTQPGIQGISVNESHFPEGSVLSITEEQNQINSLFPKVRSPSVDSDTKWKSLFPVPHKILTPKKSNSFADLRDLTGVNPAEIMERKQQTKTSIGFLSNFARYFISEENTKPVLNAPLGRTHSSSAGDLATPAIEITDEDGKKHSLTPVKSVPLGTGPKPIINSVFPNKLSVHGGERIVIDGFHLGLCPSDVEALFVCGANLVTSLEWQSPYRCFARTKPWRHCLGTVSLVTRSGGKTVSSPNIEFIHSNIMIRGKSVSTTKLSPVGSAESSTDRSDEDQESVSAFGPGASDLEGMTSEDELDPSEIPVYLNQQQAEPVTPTQSMRALSRHESYLLLRTVNEWTQTSSQMGATLLDSHNPKHILALDRNEDLKDIVTDLEDQLSALKVENAELRAYVDDLVCRVLENAPATLCANEQMEVEESVT